MRHYRINHMSLDNAHFIASELGYEIIDYDPNHPRSSLKLLIEKLNLPSYNYLVETIAAITEKTELQNELLIKFVSAKKAE